MPSRTFIRTGRKEFDDLVPLISSFLEKDVLEMSIDGKVISGFRTPDAKSIWIRDHRDILRGGTSQVTSPARSITSLKLRPQAGGSSTTSRPFRKSPPQKERIGPSTFVFQSKQTWSTGS